MYIVKHPHVYIVCKSERASERDREREQKAYRGGGGCYRIFPFLFLIYCERATQSPKGLMQLRLSRKYNFLVASTSTVGPPVSDLLREGATESPHGLMQLLLNCKINFLVPSMDTLGSPVKGYFRIPREGVR